ncbi:iron ABC transporter permease [Rhodobacteraceae bacterium RKSG542]|uniref:ABC transporter permease n=1 Tax=Pseudovibrio flavus TaxID=2529854 RepID=UPI0012BCED6F|nr:iron ABC transporter permease [Pseudovibrio flavus]MTI15726.1 iron ABC transporter permease [Pseudovibrio flavus]
MTDQVASHVPTQTSVQSILGSVKENGLNIWAALLGLFILLPVGSVLWLALSPTDNVWPHLIKYVLPEAFGTTLWLMLGVGLIVFFVGVSTAWLVTMCTFPGRRFFDIALLLPFAVPTYIIAFSYVEVMDYSGPIQSFIREIFGFQTSRDYWFPEIRSLGGATFVMGFVLYPYVYMTTRASFLIQSACALDVSRTLGAGPTRLFFKVAIPLARPAIVVGMTLALIEAMNDIGAVTFFGVKTLSFSIYDTWLNRSSLSGAAQISCAMILLVVLLMFIESYGRRKQRFHQSTGAYRSLPNYTLSGWRSGLAVLACTLPVILGFVVPASLLLDRAVRRYEELFNPTLWSAAWNTLWLSGIASVLTVVIGLALAYSIRLQTTPVNRALARLTSIGYALPGTILAVGVLFPVAALDNVIADSARSLFGISTGLLILGSGAALVYAYVVRFLAVSFGQINGGLGKISPHLDMAARTLGSSSSRTLLRIHTPLLKPVLLSAALMAFVECMKELPTTILLRPFNFETLATTVFNAASREAFEDASLPALTIVLVGIVPVIMLARTSANTFRGKMTRTRHNCAPDCRG